MAVTPDEAKKLLDEAQKCLEELRLPETDMDTKQLLSGRISQLLRWASNISLVVDP